VKGLDALDNVRGAALRIAARTPLLALVARRDARAQTRGAIAIAVAFALTAICPAFMLAIGPALLGVPHIAASLRYLVLRQDVSRRFAGATAVFALGIVASRIAERLGRGSVASAQAEIAIAFAWAALAALAATHDRRSRLRAGIAVAALASAFVLALAHPLLTRLAFVHVHNLGVVLLWVVAFRRGRFPWVTMALLAGALALLLCGATLPWTLALGGDRAFGVDLTVVGAWLVPGAAASVALPLVLAHAFTDSVHYAFWLGVVPDETVKGQGSLSWRMTWRALLRDFGRTGLAVVFTLVALVLVASAFDAEGARTAYFSVAGFHGYVEGAMTVYLLVRGVRSARGVPSGREDEVGVVAAPRRARALG
jgi:hypothetical protein